MEGKMTRTEKALKIAGFEGDNRNVLIKLETDKDGNLFYTKDEFLRGDVSHYSSFNGLMPIVERINKSTKEILKIFITPDKIIIRNTEQMLWHSYYVIDENYTLIDAFQDAILWHYRNKEQ
jgi:hypothetical protein